MTTDELVAHAIPISDDDVLALAQLDALERDLCTAIMREPRRPARRTPRLRKPGRRLALALAACAVFAFAGGSLVGSDGGGAAPAFAAEAVRIANAVPRLLLAERGWTVQRADQFSVGIGEMTFTDGTSSLDLSWNATSGGGTDDVTKYASDPSLRAGGLTEVAGHRARIYRYVGSADDFVAVWRQDGYALRFRGGAAPAPARTLAEFQQLLRALKPASVQDWLSAMPASVVLPVDQDEVVRKMLADVPLPTGFDASRLAGGGAVRDRYQLGARVAGAAACAWIGQWAKARQEGDSAAAAKAVAAMKTSRDWAILREMTSQGDYSRVVWEYADAIAGPGTVVGGKVLTVQESYTDALGCDL